MTACFSAAGCCRFLFVALVAICLPAGIQAQTASVPAEAPPAGFSEAQYVDSRGCAFARATVNGQTRWVPRLGSDRQPVCGLTPSVAASPAPPSPSPVATAPSAAPSAPPQPMPAAAAAPETAESRRAPVTTQTAPSAQTAVAGTGQRPARVPPTAAAPQIPAGIPAGDMTGIPTVPCPPGYPARGVICVEQAVFDRIVAARAAAAAGQDPSQLAPAGRLRGRYVQVGAFAVPANAARTVARLQDRGLPPQTRHIRQRGRTLQLVFAGPFDNSTDLRAALSTARAMGFRDAYVR